MADPIVDSINPFPKRDDETDHEARIRERAYEIWESAGRPEGREQEHWYAAEIQVSQHGSQSGGASDETLPGSYVAPPLANDDEEPEAPKTSGAAEPALDTSKSPVANRDLEGPRKASTTPRPTGKPMTGS